MDQIWQALDWALGLHVRPESLTVIQVAMRCITTYALGWGVMRVARTRLLSRYTAFDVVLGFVLGSVLSRSINGSAPLLTTWAAVPLLVAVHQLLAWISFRFPSASHFLNGHPQPLIRSGQVLAEQMRKNLISTGDLEEELRLRAHASGPQRIEEARLERNGEISAIKRSQVIEVQVREGVQTIRIELAS